MLSGSVRGPWRAACRAMAAAMASTLTKTEIGFANPLRRGT